MKLVVNIERLGHRAVGIGRHRGKVVFVPLTAPGDRAEVRITRTHRNYDEAVLVRLLKSSPMRREPSCPYYGLCGGCQLQHLKSSCQRVLKGELFREMVVHNGGVAGERVGEILATPEELGYRSRLDMHVLWATRPLLGFMARGSRKVVPVDCCLLVIPQIRPFLKEARRLLMKAKALNVGRVEVSCDTPGDGISIILRGSGGLSRSARNVLNRLAPDVQRLRGLYFAHRCGGKIQTLWERDEEFSGVLYSVPYPDRSGELILEAWPGGFMQVNSFANRLLINVLLSWIQEAPSERVLELYSGMGNLTIPVSHLVREIVAVEINPIAVENAKANAARYKISNVRWIVGSAKSGMQGIMEAGDSFDLVIMDPPRSGAREILASILDLAPDRILYISCDPATLVRDIRFLQQSGPYSVEKTLPLDMFPQSFHLESITLLEKKNHNPID